MQILQVKTKIWNDEKGAWQCEDVPITELDEFIEKARKNGKEVVIPEQEVTKDDEYWRKKMEKLREIFVKFKNRDTSVEEFINEIDMEL